MARLLVSKEEQKDYFSRIKLKSNLSWLELAKQFRISEKTMRDWARAVYTPDYKIVKILSRKYSVPLPLNTTILPTYWYIKKSASLGGFARFKKYGAPGDRETRRRAGIISQQRRRENPEKYRIIGCNINKQTILTRSKKLAELFGILLGDGSITDYQIRITLNRTTDKSYSIFVSKLLHEIFDQKVSMLFRENVVNLALSGVSIVKALEGLGLKRGNKVKNQICIPRWILKNRIYAKTCLRGLIDTDGGVFFHKHIVAAKLYTHFGLSLSNHSLPIIYGASKILKSFSFDPSIQNKTKLYIYKLSEVIRYFKVIGSSNKKHHDRLDTYLSSRMK